jgi:hypothetical protein
MAGFMKNPDDKNGRYDTGTLRLVMMLGEKAKIDRWSCIAAHNSARGVGMHPPL